MGDGSLTQAEIDALLQGAESISAQTPLTAGKASASQTGSTLSPVETDLVAELIYQSSLSGVPALSQLLARNVRIFSPYGEVVSAKELESRIGKGFALLTTVLSGQGSGIAGFSMNGKDASRLCSVVMGGNGEAAGSDTLDSAELTTLKDVLGPLLQATIRQISAKTGISMKPGPLQAIVSGGPAPFPFRDNNLYFDAQMSVSVDRLFDSSLHFIFSENLAVQFHEKGKGNIHRHTGTGSDYGFTGVKNESGRITEEPKADIKEVTFPQFTSTTQAPGTPNSKLLMDVQMTLTVELGRTKMYVRQLLGLGEGSIIELDKLAGEPVDLLVNGKLIAKGEVVVIDENFGVRVTDIVSPVDRIKANKRM